MSYAAGVNDNQVGFFRDFDLCQSELSEQLANLLAFILINLAAKSDYGKIFHNVI